MVTKIYRYCLIALLSLLLCVGFSPQVLALIPFLPNLNTLENALPETPAWDLNKARTCGTALCSDVYFHGNRTIRINSTIFPYLSRDIITVAATRTIGVTIRETAIEVEQRARVIQRIFRQIFDSMATSRYLGQQPDKKLQFWILSEGKPLHPLTPIVEVGYENNQIVIFIVPKPELGLTQQTVITVTRVDARANNTTIERLTETWRAIVRDSLSEALWGLEMDRQQPFLRLQISAVTVAIALMIILVIRLLGKLSYRWKRKLLKELKGIQDSLIVDAEATVTEKSRSIGVTQSNQQESENNGFQNIFNNGKKMIAEGISFSARLLPDTVLKRQNIIRQQINFSELLSSLLFLSRFTIILFSIGSIAFTYRDTRFLFNLFLTQGILLPIIWILMILADKVVDFWIDYSLNQWAKEQQEASPDSNRPNLRVNTYSPALRNATTVFFSAIALFLSFSVIGLSPGVLAGAGAFAVVFAFLTRNLLEDMLNGILILVTDRYAVGDVVEINGMMGLVESMNLYTTSLRDLDGNLKVITNGRILTVINMTKDWSRVNFTVQISWNADIKKALTILQNVADQMYQEPTWQEKMLTSAEILGIDDIKHDGVIIRLLIKTKPVQQWDVGREFRWRVKEAFDLAGIQIGIPQQEIIHHYPENQLSYSFEGMTSFNSNSKRSS